MHRGYIKLWRRIEESFLMLDSEAFHLWCVLLMLANHENREHIFNNKKIIINKGQLISGRQSLSDRTNIHESKIYRLLELFEHEQIIEQQKNNRYTIISIVNYNDYQSNEQQNEQPVNNQRTTSEQPVNTPKALINIKKIYIAPKNLHLEYVYLTQDQHTSLINRFGEKYTTEMIDRLNNYIGSKGVKYKSHYHTILNWAKKDSPINNVHKTRGNPL